MKLYDVPKNSRIGVEHLGLEMADTGEKIKELDFHHLDGIFSYCEYKGEPVKIAAYAEVEYLGPIQK